MRLITVAAAFLFVSCGSDPKPAVSDAPATARPARPVEEFRRFPKKNLNGSQVIDRELMSKRFMPGGTLANYKKGRIAYEIFIAKTANPAEAALLLTDWRNALTAPKLIPSFGGFFGQDAGRPVFVFAKGAFLAGIAGLAEQDAEREARILAAQI